MRGVFLFFTADELKNYLAAVRLAAVLGQVNSLPGAELKPPISDRNHLVVCEGVIDALSVASVGTAAVAVLGATYVAERAARDVARGAGGRS